MDKIKVGVAGVGFIGPAHIEALRRIPGIEVISVYHNGKEVKEKAEALQVPNFFDDYDEFIASGLDTVHICTPNFLHYEMAKKALDRDIHVICEKPLAISINEAESLIELAQTKGLVHAVHFNVRYYPIIRQLKRMREKGELGEIYHLIGSYLQDWLFYETDYNWRLEPEQSGESRAIADIGSHLLDLLEYITGLKTTHVMADFNTIHKVRKKPTKPIDTYSGKLLKPSDYEDVPINTEDTANVLLRFDNGTKGSITVSQVAAGRKNRISFEISGSKRNVSWDSERPNEVWVGHRDEPNHLLMRDPALFDEEAASLVAFPGGHNEGFPDTSKQLFKEVYQAIREGSQPKEPSFPTFHDGLRELILCERIIESHKTEKWVRV